MIRPSHGLATVSGAAAFGDERLLPSVFQEISTTFGSSLTQLGFLTFAGAFASAIMTPIAGIIGAFPFPTSLNPNPPLKCM